MKAVVTAGPTREHIDPVRFISNPSTGKMGFAVAKALADLGCETVLIAGPVSLKTPKGVRRIDVVSARDMFAAVKAEMPADVFVSTAAVADWRPLKCAEKKLRKGEMDGTLHLVRNPDILKTLSVMKNRDATLRGLRLIGFAAQTGDPVAEGARKCREKGLEFVVANDVTEKGSGFGVSTNRVSIVFKDGSVESLPMMSKVSLGRRIALLAAQR